MPHIVIDDEQARIVAESQGTVEILDRTGRHVGVASRGVSEEEIEEALAALRSDQPRYTTQEILDHLQSLKDGQCATR